VTSILKILGPGSRGCTPAFTRIFPPVCSSGLVTSCGCSAWMRPTPQLRLPFILVSPLIRRRFGKNRRPPRLIGRTRYQRMPGRTERVTSLTLSDSTSQKRTPKMSFAEGRQTTAESLSLSPRGERRRRTNPALSRTSPPNFGGIRSCAEKTRKRFSRGFHSALGNLTTSGETPEN
jgi:hypothetical protein